MARITRLLTQHPLFFLFPPSTQAPHYPSVDRPLHLVPTYPHQQREQQLPLPLSLFRKEPTKCAQQTPNLLIRTSLPTAAATITIPTKAATTSASSSPRCTTKTTKGQRGARRRRVRVLDSVPVSMSITTMALGGGGRCGLKPSRSYHHRRRRLRRPRSQVSIFVSPRPLLPRVITEAAFIGGALRRLFPRRMEGEHRWVVDEATLLHRRESGTW